MTVSHAREDSRVGYQDGIVRLDGEQLNIVIYGETIKAAEVFKYLGVEVDRDGSPIRRMKARLSAMSVQAERFLAVSGLITTVGQVIILLS